MRWLHIRTGSQTHFHFNLKRYYELSFIVVVLLFYGSFTLFRLGLFDLGSDEGRFGLSALNILSDYHQLAIVSEEPLGGPGTKPYIYPMFLAISMAVLGKNEFAIRAVNVIALAIAAWFLYGLVGNLLNDRALALLTFALFLLNPGTITYARCAMPEPFVVVWGCMGLFAAAQFCLYERLRWAVLCGLALGFGFLSKLWLVLPFLLGCVILLAAKFREEYNRKFIHALVLGFFLFLLVSASHLFLVLWLAPELFPHWRSIYYVSTFKSRVAGSGYDPTMWYRPWWFYLAAFFKASFFGLPLVILGFHSLLKRHNLAATIVIAVLLSPILILSIFRVKQASYIFPAFPALALLLGLGCIYFAREAQRREVAFASLLSLAVAGFFLMKGVFDLREFSSILVLYLLPLTLVVAGPQFRILAKGIVFTALASAMLFAGALVVRNTLQHRTYYREIAAYFGPQLLSKNPQDMVFIAPEHPAMEFYTFRSGEYWETYYFQKSTSTFIHDLQGGAQLFYVVDPSGTLYGGRISPEKLKALYDHVADVTPEIENLLGEKITLQVFAAASWR